MRKFYSLLLLSLLCTTAFGKMPMWKKQIWVGSALTVGAAGLLTGAGFTLPAGISYLASEDDDDDNAILPAIGYLTGGSIMLAFGIGFGIAGPMVIANGVKTGREEKAQPVSLGFSPIRNKLLDKYQGSQCRNKLATVSITF